MSSYGSPSLSRRAPASDGAGGGGGGYDKARPRGSVVAGGGPAASSVPNRTVQQLQRDETPPALNFLARRGSEAEASTASEVESAYEEEAMANAERELAADAEWKRIQQNTFTR